MWRNSGYVRVLAPYAAAHLAQRHARVQAVRAPGGAAGNPVPRPAALQRDDPGRGGDPAEGDPGAPRPQRRAHHAAVLRPRDAPDGPGRGAGAAGPAPRPPGAGLSGWPRRPANYRGNYRGTGPPNCLGGPVPFCLPRCGWEISGALGRIRTHDPLVRSQASRFPRPPAASHFRVLARAPGRLAPPVLPRSAAPCRPNCGENCGGRCLQGRHDRYGPPLIVERAQRPARRSSGAQR